MTTTKWRSPHDKSSSGSKESAIKFALLLSLLAFFIQLIGFYLSASLSLLSDTLHVFTDLLSLGLAFGAVKLSEREPSEVLSFGWYRMEVLASFVNGLLLLGVGIYIAVEAIERLMHPKDIISIPLLISAVVGLLLNLLSAWLLSKADHSHDHHHHGHHHHGHHHEHHISEGKTCGHGSHGHSHEHHRDRNLHSATLHVLSDALGSCAVIVGAILYQWLGWQWLDPVIGLILMALVSFWSVRVIKDSAHVLLESTPKHINVKNLIRDLKECDEKIVAIEDLHVWEITSRMYALTVNIIVKEITIQDAEHIRKKMSELVVSRYGVAHPTFSIQLV